MDFLQAVILAIIQGATEFLPVSSSGHLVIVPELLGWKSAPLCYIIILHFGTLAAVVAYYWYDLVAIATDIFAPQPAGKGDSEDDATVLGNTSGRHLAILILISTIPAAVVGFLLEDFFDNLVSEGGPIPAAVALLVTAGILFAADRAGGESTPRDLDGLDALYIGIAQAFAIIPGISRSGACVAASLWRGLTDGWAPRFAFLMSIPPIAGAFGLAIAGLADDQPDWFTQLPVYITGFVVAAAVGYLAIIAVVKTVKQGKLFVRFGIYCIALSLFSITASLLGWI
ncbi:MAG: undecaprenyl-diphosphate phosphatase [Armatimonadota bacterium]